MHAILMVCGNACLLFRINLSYFGLLCYLFMLLMFSVSNPYSTCIEFDPDWTAYIQIHIQLGFVASNESISYSVKDGTRPVRKDQD